MSSRQIGQGRNRIMTNPLEITRLSIQLFCVSTLFAMGLGITLDDVKAPFRNLLALTIIIAVNNLLVPLLGLLIVAAPTLLQGGYLPSLPNRSSR
jgi:predicted Na+-dependent transporter